MVIKLPDDTARLFVHQYVIAEITEDIRMQNIQF